MHVKFSKYMVCCAILDNMPLTLLLAFGCGNRVTWPAAVPLWALLTQNDRRMMQNADNNLVCQISIHFLS